MGVEMFLFENSVLKMYLLNTNLNFHINSFNYFILFICFIMFYIYIIFRFIRCFHVNRNLMTTLFDKTLSNFLPVYMKVNYLFNLFFFKVFF